MPRTMRKITDHLLPIFIVGPQFIKLKCVFFLTSPSHRVNFGAMLCGACSPAKKLLHHSFGLEPTVAHRGPICFPGLGPAQE